MPSAGGPNPVIVVNKLPLSEVVRAAFVVLGLMGGAYFLWCIQAILFLLFVAILLATAIEPIVNRLRRGPFSRGGGVFVVYTAIMLTIALAAYLALPTAMGEGTAFVENLPQRLQTLRGKAQHSSQQP